MLKLKTVKIFVKNATLGLTVSDVTSTLDERGVEVVRLPILPKEEQLLRAAKEEGQQKFSSFPLHALS
jgi:NAD-dependent oxidoreductase involved in siderophore biosynthesis